MFRHRLSILLDSAYTVCFRVPILDSFLSLFLLSFMLWFFVLRLGF